MFLSVIFGVILTENSAPTFVVGIQVLRWQRPIVYISIMATPSADKAASRAEPT